MQTFKLVDQLTGRLMGVRADRRGCGIGHHLFEALAAWARRHEVAEVHTAADWRETAILGWFDALGFELSPDLIVESARAFGEKFGIRMDKRHQKANWGARPLTKEQIHYARLDTHYLFDLRDALEKHRLQQLEQQQHGVELLDAVDKIPLHVLGSQRADGFGQRHALGEIGGERL